MLKFTLLFEKANENRKPAGSFESRQFLQAYAVGNEDPRHEIGPQNRPLVDHR